MQIEMEFLQQSPGLWKTSEDYVNSCRKVQQLKVVKMTRLNVACH